MLRPDMSVYIKTVGYIVIWGRDKCYALLLPQGPEFSGPTFSGPAFSAPLQLQRLSLRQLP